MTEERKPVLLERMENILVITINRPEAANAVNGEVAALLDTALNEAENDPETAAVILTGAGDRVFCSGQDLKAMSDGNSGCMIPGHGWGGIAERYFPKPMIAAVNGFALGGGTEIALACDMIVAAEHASFGLPEVKRGLFAVGGGAIRLANAVPKAVAMEMLMTGDPISARRAYEIGLVNAVVPGTQLMEAAVTLAKRIVCNAPLSLMYTKRLCYKAMESTTADAFATSDLVKEIIKRSEDAKEGPRAFSEKRPPQWKGR